MAGSGIANAQTVIWEATVTVEELGNRKGYSALAEIGSLSNTTFSYKGRSLTVNGVQVSVIEGTTELFFEIDVRFAVVVWSSFARLGLVCQPRRRRALHDHARANVQVLGDVVFGADVADAGHLQRLSVDAADPARLPFRALFSTALAASWVISTLPTLPLARVRVNPRLALGLC